MLEIKNLTKVYTPKKGVPVTALGGVDLKFADTGMVFLLGKSGSGKSTLLNLLGGLDRYTDGEIIINGVSSKDFKQNHFDSYRNTYVGFIFQEYNILDEFNVGENIAIALELQGKKATDEAINKILNQVDLDGYGNRKPNELSGGQKQRVAIARALVKNPEIIMADEPTGALDSNTGKQVFDMLKKLSREKLVIVVSHDREFAENYADRIIELSDGKVIGDVTLDCEFDGTKADNLVFEDNTVTVNEGYHLTEDDLKRINDYIDGLKSGKLSMNFNKKSDLKFKNTDTDKIVSQGKGFNLIKSKLPMRNAFKMGAGGLKHKKFRLVITIFLSCIAFGLFGLADTFSAYNHIKVCTNSIYDSGVDYAAVVKSYKFDDRWYDSNYYITEKDIADIKTNTGVALSGVFIPKNCDLSFESNINAEIETTETDYDIYTASFSGYTEITAKKLKEFGYELVAGKLPDGTKNEIVVSDYIFKVLSKKQYTDGTLKKDAKGNDVLTYIDINNYDDLIGKTLNFDNKKYTVTGIVDTQFDLSRYESLTEKKDNASSAQQIIDYALINEFYSHKGNSLASMVMVGEGAIEKLASTEPPVYNINKGYMWFSGSGFSINPNYITTLDKINISDVVWLGSAKTSLADNEIVVFENEIYFYDSEPKVLKDDGTVDWVKSLKNNNVNLAKNMFGENDYSEDEGFTVVGVIPNSEKYTSYGDTAIVSEKVLNEFSTCDNGIYREAIGAMPQDKDGIKTLVSYCYAKNTEMRFPLQNAATFELDSISEEIKEFAKIFLYIGLGFAVFAAVMLANFIGTSISYKKQEIGILRAIGSRSNDVFRIFFSESFIIAMINFVLSVIGVFAVTRFINYIIRANAGILITLLTFDLRQILLLFLISVFVAFAASFVPVYKIASKRPIDAIRDR